MTDAIAVPLWRRLLLSPVLWGIVLLTAAVLLTLADANLDFPQFLLMLVGGWCLGVAFANLTYRMPRNGLILHIGVAVILAAVMVFFTEVGGRLLASAPEPLKAVIAVAQLAAVPATAWIWLALLGRGTDAMTRRERRKAPVRVPPEWERDERGDGSFVRFRAIEVRMRDVTIAIVGIVLVCAAIGIVVMILADDVVMRLGPKMSIVILALVIGLPAYGILTAVLRRRTEDCTVAFGNDELRIGVGSSAYVVRYSDLEELRWRTRSDYARIEVRGGGVDLSLFTGLAKAPVGRSAELPELPRRVFRRLELMGLSMEKSRRSEVVTFRRA
ncbi:MAG: hypothetical protein J7484_02795 [Microbacterium sp.]|nr:hypothetical protein [Microbacterium sp.]